MNENAALMGMHTAFVREHNRIEAKLHSLNPHWEGKRLRQETRRIVIAEWQHIIYNEYLPAVLGPIISQQYGLTLQTAGFYNSEFSNVSCEWRSRRDTFHASSSGLRTNIDGHKFYVFVDYDNTVNPDASNGFATAAFRFGHSMIQSFINLTNVVFRNFSPIAFSTVSTVSLRSYFLTTCSSKRLPTAVRLLAAVSKPNQYLQPRLPRIRLYSQRILHGCCSDG